MFTKKPLPADLPALYALVTEACTHMGEAPLPAEGFVRFYASAMQEQGQFLRLVFDGEELAGFAQGVILTPLPLLKTVCQVPAFYIAPPFRKKGGGGGLLLSVLSAAKAAGARELQFSASRVDLSAQAFLEKNGFSRRAHLYGRKIEI